MKKLIIALLFVFIAVNQQSCKVRKQVHTETKKSDSSAVHNATDKGVSASKDSDTHDDIFNYFHMGSNTSLTAGDVDYTETESPDVHSSLSFPIDSVTTKKDTVVGNLKGGGKVNIYSKNGQINVDVDLPGKKKKHLHASNVKFEAQQNIDTGTAKLKGTNVHTALIDTTKKVKDSTHVVAADKTKDKNVQKKTTGFNFNVIWIVSVVLVLLAVFAYLILKKKSKV